MFEGNKWEKSDEAFFWRKRFLGIFFKEKLIF